MFCPSKFQTGWTKSPFHCQTSQQHRNEGNLEGPFGFEKEVLSAIRSTLVGKWQEQAQQASCFQIWWYSQTIKCHTDLAYLYIEVIASMQWHHSFCKNEISFIFSSWENGTISLIALLASAKLQIMRRSENFQRRNFECNPSKWRGIGTHEMFGPLSLRRSPFPLPCTYPLPTW